MVSEVMETIFVQFKDETNTQIIATFSCPQSLDDAPVQGEVEVDDPLYVSYVESLSPSAASVITDPVERLKAFLAANPDVAAILS